MAIFVFIFGLIMGSFYDVVGLRIPNGESIVKPGSHCPKCNHKLHWYENIPVLSYILLGGKCSNCKEHISLMYPLTELLCGILFLFCYLLFGISESFYISLIISSLVVIIFITDSKYYIILDSPLLIGAVLIFIIRWTFEGVGASLIYLAYGLLIFMVMYLLMLFGNFIFKKESLGGGDIKLSFIAGMTLGPWLGLFYIVLSSFLAFPYAIYISLRKKTDMLPFGPFLVTSLLIIYYNYDFVVILLKTIMGLN